VRPPDKPDDSPLVVQIFDIAGEVSSTFRFDTLGLAEPLALNLRNGFVATFGHTSLSSQRHSWRCIQKFAAFMRETGIATEIPLPSNVAFDLRSWLVATSLSLSNMQAVLNTALAILAYCERNSPHLLSRGTRLAVDNFSGVQPSHRPVLSAEIVKHIISFCHQEIAEIECRLAQGHRLMTNRPQSEMEAHQAALVGELLELGNGSMPLQAAIGNAGMNLSRRVATAGGLRKISRMLWPCPDAIFPFYLAMVIQTGGNPSSVLNMKRDCVIAHPLRDDLERVVWDKPRAHREQRAEAPIGRPWSAPSLARRVMEVNKNLVATCSARDGDKLFIAYRLPGKKPGVADASIHCCKDRSIKHRLDS
jgi:hypothetical protein